MEHAQRRALRRQRRRAGTRAAGATARCRDASPQPGIPCHLARRLDRDGRRFERNGSFRCWRGTRRRQALPIRQCRARCRYTRCRYTRCRYARCRYARCRYP
ncbi:hypothetical protein DDE05_16910, partial [Streptomyces cavourensis]